MVSSAETRVRFLDEHSSTRLRWYQQLKRECPHLNEDTALMLQTKPCEIGGEKEKLSLLFVCDDYDDVRKMQMIRNDFSKTALTSKWASRILFQYICTKWAKIQKKVIFTEEQSRKKNPKQFEIYSCTQFVLPTIFPFLAIFLEVGLFHLLDL